MYLIFIESHFDPLYSLLFLGYQHQDTHFGHPHYGGHGGNSGGEGGCKTYTRGNVDTTCCNGVIWQGNNPVCRGDDEEESASTDYDYDEDEDSADYDYDEDEGEDYSASADQYYAEE